MAKRFTDTDKWKDPWFNELDLKAKVTWMYLCDNCDFAGIWRGDFKLLSFHLGTNISASDFENWFKGRVLRFDDKYFIKAFFDFQYGNSKDSFRAKQSALAVIEKLGFSDRIKDHLDCPPTVPQESPDCLSVSVSKSISNSSSLRTIHAENLVTPDDLEYAYSLYPLKKGKGDGLKKAKSTVKNKIQLEQLISAICAYRDQCIRDKTEARYIKHFDTFINSSWQDYLDPTTGTSAISTTSDDPFAFLEKQKEAL